MLPLLLLLLLLLLLFRFRLLLRFAPRHIGNSIRSHTCRTRACNTCLLATPQASWEQHLQQTYANQ
jgi:hypothetical protein